MVRYSLVCNERGGVRDDVLVYCYEEDDYMLVVNASNRLKLMDWFRGIKERENMTFSMEDVTASTAMAAIQGPKVIEMVGTMSREIPTLKRYRFAEKSLVGRTGYTGEDGFEIFTDLKTGPKIWNRLLEVGQADGLLPCGLGSRDSLRLEAGLPLNGQDLSYDISPVEAGMGFFVDVNRPRSFSGRAILEKQKKEGTPRVTIGLITEPGQAPPRHGYPVFQGGKQIGEITSGLPSPTLGHGIALALVSAPAPTLGQLVEFEVRGRRVPAKVSKRKFLQNR